MRCTATARPRHVIRALLWRPRVSLLACRSRRRARSHRHVPHRGAGAQDGPGGAEAEDAPRRSHLRPQLPHLRRAAADHSFHPEEAGQYMNTYGNSVYENIKWTVAAFPCLLIKRCARGRHPILNGYKMFHLSISDLRTIA